MARDITKWYELAIFDHGPLLQMNMRTTSSVEDRRLDFVVTTGQVNF